MQQTAPALTVGRSVGHGSWVKWVNKSGWVTWPLADD